MSQESQQQITIIDDTFLEDKFEKKDQNKLFVTVILNRPIDSLTLNKMSRITDILLCADGGANHLFETESLKEKFIPKAIIGDLTSIQHQVKTFYEQKGVEFKKDDDDTKSDLQKLICQLFEQNFYGYSDKQSVQVTILGAFGGRMGHTLANLSTLQEINCLFCEKKIFQQYNVTMMDRYSIIHCLCPGKYEYKRAKGIELNKGVGFIPLGNFNNAKVKTKGFKRNLDDQQLEFGKCVSSSNQFLDDYQDFPCIETEGTLFMVTTLLEK